MSLPHPAHDPIWDIIQRTSALNAQPTTPGGTGFRKRSREVETPTEWGSLPILGLWLGQRREAKKSRAGGSPGEEEEDEEEERPQEQRIDASVGVGGTPSPSPAQPSTMDDTIPADSDEEETVQQVEPETYTYAVAPTCADRDVDGEVDTYGACVWLGPREVMVCTRARMLIMTRNSTDMITLARTIRTLLHHHDLLSILVIGRNLPSTRDLGMALRGRRRQTQTRTRVWALPSSMANVQRWGVIPGMKPGVPAPAGKALVDGAFDWALTRLSHMGQARLTQTQGAAPRDGDDDDCDPWTKLAFTLKAPWDLSPTRHRVNTQPRRDGTGMVLPVLLRTPGMAIDRSDSGAIDYWMGNATVPSPSAPAPAPAPAPLTGRVLDCWLALLPRATALVKVLPSDSVRPDTGSVASSQVSTPTPLLVSASADEHGDKDKAKVKETLVLAPIATAGGWMLAAAWPNQSEGRMMLYDPLGPPPQTRPGRAVDKARKESLQKFVRLAIPSSRWEDVLFATELEPSTTGADLSGTLVLYVAKQLVERYRDKAPELGPEAWRSSVQ